MGACMCDDTGDTGGDTGAFLKVLDVRYENLNSGWVKTFLYELNEQVGRLKHNVRGSAILQVLWHGGNPGAVDWLVKLKEKKSRH